MRRSLKLGQIAGIGVFVHWTFFLLLAWVAYIHVAAGENATSVVTGVVFILALFGCVVLHELGHALTARRYGCGTRDITLLPIGGVARLVRIPEVPMQEFWVAVAGPAVNVVIASLLFGILAVMGETYRMTSLNLIGEPFLANLMLVNVALVLFNMLPAFPMDGGRVLRALLAMRMPRVKATHVAAGVGQVMAILFGIGGLLSGNWWLLIIAVFVYFGAIAESQAVALRSICKNYRVSDAMIDHFCSLDKSELVIEAAEESSKSHQQEFPVTDGHQAVGLVLHRDIVKALSRQDGNRQVADIMQRDCPSIDEDEPLDRALDSMNARGCPALLVKRQGALVGILSQQHLGQWLMLQSSIHSRPTAAKPPDSTKPPDKNIPERKDHASVTRVS